MEEVGETGNVKSFKFRFEPQCYHSPTHGDAEMLAAMLLARGTCDSESLIKLARLLPSESIARTNPDQPSGKFFITGAYVHGGICGIRRATRKFPATTRLLTALAQSLCKPGFCFSSVGLSYNNLAPRHVDKFNAPGTQNGLAKLSPFDGGGLILHSADQSSNLKFDGNTLYFDAHESHETEPWTQGERLILVAYTTSGLDKLPPDEAKVLLDAGFSLSGTNAFCAMPPARPKLPNPVVPNKHLSPVLQSAKRAFPPECPKCPNPESPKEQVPSDGTNRQQKIPRAPGPNVPTAASPELGITIEVFCGCARLSTALQELGFESLAFDHIAKSNHPVQTLDLTDPAQAKILEDVIENQAERIRLIHFAPPCGTASAARQKPIPSFIKNGVPIPQPLRTSKFLLGLPNLRGTDAARVQSANTLYSLTGRLALLGHSLGIVISREPFIKPLLGDPCHCGTSSGRAWL